VLSLEIRLTDSGEIPHLPEFLFSRPSPLKTGQPREEKSSNWPGDCAGDPNHHQSLENKKHAKKLTVCQSRGERQGQGDVEVSIYSIGWGAPANQKRVSWIGHGQDRSIYIHTYIHSLTIQVRGRLNAVMEGYTSQSVLNENLVRMAQKLFTRDVEPQKNSPNP
jgi:hypothetical protein